jgi:hypothetical protein
LRVDDRHLLLALADAERIERDVRLHLSVVRGAFEQSRGQAAYRGAVALRKALEQWIVTRAQGPRPVEE